MTRDEKLKIYGQGPWVDEPDRVEFEAHGLPCLVVRHPELGSLCGYVAVPPGHPLHGVDYHVATDLAPLSAHGGVNYSKPCTDEICHVPKPGEPDDVWWFGFHCSCGWDYVPYMGAWLGERDPFRKRDHGNYRNLNYVRIECEALASQLAVVAAFAESMARTLP